MEGGLAYLNMGRYQEAVPLIERFVKAVPNDRFAHLGLSIAYTELGRDQDARAQVAEVLHIDPGFTLPPPDKWPWKNSRFAQLQYVDLRKAGLK